MNNNYITVSEFATKAGISKQRVYQLLNKSLKEFVQEVDGKKVIDIKGLELFENNENHSRVEQTFKQYLNKSLIDTLQTTIVVLQKQLEEKDRQIAELTEIVKTQSQSINAANHADLADKLKIESSEQKEEREKQSFWKRLFNKE